MWFPGKKSSFQLSSIVFLRGLGFVYFVAFLCLYNDLIALLGSNGLLPAHLYIDQLHSHYGDVSTAFWETPSLFHFGISDSILQYSALLGLILSVALMLGYANVPIVFVLWVLYFSFVSIGQRWYAFGWEFQLLETGFLGIFLVPFLYGHKNITPPKAIIYLGWWLTARIMWGAGLIKIRGDECWRDLSCLNFHFETQPVPNFFSPFLHNLPETLLASGVLFNHFVELIVPFALLTTSKIRNAAGLCMIFFQIVQK